MIREVTPWAREVQVHPGNVARRVGDDTPDRGALREPQEVRQDPQHPGIAVVGKSGDVAADADVERPDHHLEDRLIGGVEWADGRFGRGGKRACGTSDDLRRGDLGRCRRRGGLLGGRRATRTGNERGRGHDGGEAVGLVRHVGRGPWGSGGGPTALSEQRRQVDPSSRNPLSPRILPRSDDVFTGSSPAVSHRAVGQRLGGLP